MSGRGATRRSRAPDVPGMGEMAAGEYAGHAARCSGKVDIPNRRRARRAAKKATRDYGKRFRAYRCPICGKWHLTTHPWKERA